jgi:hypothetical protein
MSLKHAIAPLRGLIGNFLYHNRQKLVIDILWEEAKHRFNEDNVFTRRQMFIDLINERAEKERPGCTDPDFFQKSKKEQRALIPS